LQGLSVADKKQPVKPTTTVAPKRGVARQKAFTMRHLYRMALWAMTAAGALLLAVLSTRSEVGSERIAASFPSLHGRTQVAAAARSSAQPLDAQAETRHLTAAVDDLTAENNELRKRLALVERNMEDVTGSVSRQIAAVKAETAPPWPPDAKPELVTPANATSLVNPTPAGLAVPLPFAPAVVPATVREATAEPTASATDATEYAVDVGSALSIEVLRARWLGIRSAHMQLFAGLTPTVEVREIPRTNRSELRLVVGPLPNAEAAAQLCAALVPYRLSCQPTVFDRQHVVLR
jgi:hypothetical protein